jgi:hypothetical protein
MTRSITVSANFVCKMHVALLEAPRKGVEAIVPTIDGAYIVCSQRDDLLNSMRSAMKRLANLFVGETNRYEQFLVRGGIAYGPVVLGSTMGKDESKVFQNEQNRSYVDTILIGMPVIQAYEVESSAPPFGVRVDMSARAFAPEGEKPMRSAYWRWHEKGKDDELVKSIKVGLDRYFAFMKAHEHEVGYKEEDRKRHDALWREYFWSSDDEKKSEERKD